VAGLVAAGQQGLRKAARDCGGDDLRGDEPAHAAPTGAGSVNYFRPDDAPASSLQNSLLQGVLENALRAQAEEESRRRGRRGRRRGAGRPRVDYTSPEHAGEPHRGRITDEEKEYIREHLEEVNVRLERDGYRTIDPSDPDMAERYGFSAS
jgi:hypothetical protein